MNGCPPGSCILSIRNLCRGSPENIQIVKCQVMDYDKFSADDLCGSCTVKVSDLHLGYNACCLETIPAFAVYVLWCMARGMMVGMGR